MDGPSATVNAKAHSACTSWRVLVCLGTTATSVPEFNPVRAPPYNPANIAGITTLQSAIRWGVNPTTFSRSRIRHEPDLATGSYATLTDICQLLSRLPLTDTGAGARVASHILGHPPLTAVLLGNACHAASAINSALGTRCLLQSLRNATTQHPLASYIRVDTLVSFHAALLGLTDDPNTWRPSSVGAAIAADPGSVLCSAVDSHYHAIHVSGSSSLPADAASRRLYLHVLQSVLNVIGTILHITCGYMSRAPKSTRETLLRAQWTVSYMLTTSPVHPTSRSGLHRYAQCAVPPCTVRPRNARDPSVPSGFIYLLYHIGIGRWYIG